ncbi:hypothetical protein J3458_019633 [Metarhizium acridum]|uniref:uncharacterized protein n=1 Tax=Metarhizium acridum TaxID=92637 RepID=UPI001C6B760A|nr:hypothetical protein J3458_019633 [Metarhizium acridum]
MISMDVTHARMPLNKEMGSYQVHLRRWWCLGRFLSRSHCLKSHILASHLDIEHSAIDDVMDVGRRDAGIHSVSCPLCRPGLVTSDMGEDEDHENPILFKFPDRKLGLVKLEEDENITTRIHEFSLHSIPCIDYNDRRGRQIQPSGRNRKSHFRVQNQDKTCNCMTAPKFGN